MTLTVGLTKGSGLAPNQPYHQGRTTRRRPRSFWTLVVAPVSACLFFASLSLQSRLRVPPDNGGGVDAVGSLPVSASAGNATVTEPWASPYQVDCSAVATAPEAGEGGNDGGGGVFVTTKTDPPFRMNIHDPSRDGVSREIQQKGCWECKHINDMAAALRTYDGAYFLDVGGNIGMWSLTAASLDRRVFTIEALPANVERICGSVRANPPMAGRIGVLNVAATSEPKTFKFSVPAGNMGGTRVIDAGGGGGNDDEVTVRGATIDSLKLPTDIPVVLKVDVEGHELQALWGAMEFLKKADVVYAAMELRPKLDADERWGTIFRVLTDKGLRPHRVNYEDETPLDVDDLGSWKHFKHPIVKYYDVVWRKDEA